MNHVLVADDHEVTRRGIREILRDAFPGVVVVEASDGAGVLRSLPTEEWSLVLLDVFMPGGSILQLIGSVRAAKPKVPVLVLTGATEVELVLETLKAGANGFIHKHRAASELVVAAQAVANGGRYLDPESAGAVAEALSAPKEEPLHERLSPRELDIFRRIALGRAVKEVGADLGISEKTVATYLSRIREKTGLSSHVEIARYALHHRIVD